jgi:hypothetical protein
LLANLFSFQTGPTTDSPKYSIYPNVSEKVFLIHHLKMGNRLRITHKVKHILLKYLKTQRGPINTVNIPSACHLVLFYALDTLPFDKYFNGIF